MDSIDTFAKRNIRIVIVINVIILLFIFNLAQFIGIATLIFAIGLLVLFNVLFYHSFKDEKLNVKEFAGDMKDAKKEESEQAYTPQEREPNEIEQRIFDEFEQEMKKLPISERTNVKAGEVLDQIRKKYEDIKR